jgi:dTDP-L-rhamnose 4-epimerase
VLLTGGAGFIGQHMLASLLARGYQVRALDSLRPDVHAGPWTPPDGVQLQVGDVHDPAAVDRALAGVDTAIGPA